MTNAERIEAIKKAMTEYQHIGIRGLSGVNYDKKYRANQIMKKSFDMWDRDYTYSSAAKYLRGTSAIDVNDLMDDDEILFAIGRAQTYSDKLCLVAGKFAEYGDDSREVVLANGWGMGDQGARFIMYL